MGDGHELSFARTAAVAVTEAIDLYREIGMPKDLEMAEELLAGAQARS